jgi:hypothetical protein
MVSLLGFLTHIQARTVPSQNSAKKGQNSRENAKIMIIFIKNSQMIGQNDSASPIPVKSESF